MVIEQRHLDVLILDQKPQLVEYWCLGRLTFS